MAATTTTSKHTAPAPYKSATESTPELSALLRVNKSEKAFGTSVTSLVSRPPGALFARITGSTPTDTDTYATVQSGRNTRIDLNSDLVYVNHSCQPSLVFDMARFEVRVVEDHPLRVGDDLTFFYPSSEWKMAQPFDCRCGAKKCLGRIEGAATMEESVLRLYWLNDHIEELLRERKRSSKLA